MKNEIVLDTKPALMVLAEIFRVSSNSDRITKNYGEGKCRLLWEYLILSVTTIKQY